MSAHAGICYFDRRPIPPSVSATLVDSLAPYGPDGGADASPAPGVMMAARRLQVTVEDRADTQPVELANGGHLTWDGRLDNRLDLMAELGMPASVAIADATVVGRAIERWGEERTWPRLIGDWSAALWDPESRSIVLANDFMGVRPLYFLVADSYCAWSTALEGLVSITGRRTDLDDVFFMCSVMRSRMPGRTPYRGIHALMAGHRTRIDANGVRDGQYWHLPDTMLRYRDRRDYQVRLRELLRQAVARRIRSDRPVWMELSGGWDSSSIVCMAARLAEEGGPVPQLATVSYVLPDDPESDETRFIASVEEQVGLPHEHVALHRGNTFVIPNPVHFRTASSQVLAAYERMRAAGARALLSGRMGDGVFGNFPVEHTSIVAALRGLQLPTLVRELRAWSLDAHETAWSLLGHALGELAPARYVERRDAASVLASLTHWAKGRRLKPEEVFSVPPAAMEHFYAVQAIHTRWRLREHRDWRSSQFLAAAALYSLNLELSSPPEAPDVCKTYPLTDRDLIEYVASIPATVLCEPRRPRALMRNAIGPILPRRIEARFSKGHAAPFGARLARESAGTLLASLDTSHSVARGYVSRDGLRMHAERALAGLPHDSGFLIHTLHMERWFAALDAKASAAA
jgi:asparagine synthetase B (glutamine-hydrolysing)